MKIAVLMGGISTERNVSIAGGKAVVEALQSLGHDAIPIDPAFGAEAIEKTASMINKGMQSYPSLEELSEYSPRELMNCINSNIFDDIDVAFNVLHGTYGEDGFIQSLLELRGIPYTGSDVNSSAIAMDKLKSKMIFRSSNIATPGWIELNRDEVGDKELYKQIKGSLGNKMIVKPNDQGSTIGITLIENGNLDELHEAVLLATKYSNRIIVERFIEGREITVGIVGGEALPVIEIVPHEGFYDYESKYQKGKTEYICPADLSEDIFEFTQDMAIASYEALDCSGFARADFRLDHDGQPWCLEINTVPGFTELSLVPMAAKHVGVDFPQLCDKIVNIALEDYKNKKR